MASTGLTSAPHSRTDGAPTLPIKGPDDLALEALARQILRDFDVTPEEAMQMARAQHMEAMDAAGGDAAGALAGQYTNAGMPADRAGRLARAQVGIYGEAGAAGLARENAADPGRVRRNWEEQQALDARHQKMQDDYYAATGLPGGRPPEPDMSETDVLRGDEPGTVRRWNPATGRYDTVAVLPAEGRTSAEPNPELGRPWGGGTPFRTQEERDAYLERPEIDKEKEAEARAAGATPEQIARGRMSKRDQDMAASGSGSSTGWAPIYDPRTGRVVLAQRALGQSTELGNSEAATGGRTAGPMTESRDVSPLPSRQDLLDRGYEVREMQGPNGMERVYVLPETMPVTGEDGKPQQVDRSQYWQGQRDIRTKRRLMAQAGVSPAAAADMSADSLRDLIAVNRAQEKKNKELQWRPRTMMQAGNAVGALALPGMEDAQQAFILGRGATPLDVEARSAENALRMLNNDIIGEGLGGRREMAAQARSDRMREEAFKFAQSEAKRLRGWWGGEAVDSNERSIIRRRVEARFGPGYGDVVDALPDRDGPPPPPAAGQPSPPPASAGPRAWGAAPPQGPGL
jgi:hypothetical protein